MVFDSRGEILEADDGGIYRLINPSDDPALGDRRHWISLNNDLTITEFNSVGYDPVNQVILGGTQDVGTIIKSSQVNVTRAPADSPEYQWETLMQGDGGVVQVDSASGLNPILYYTYANLELFTRRDTGTGDDTRLALRITGTGAGPGTD